LYVVWSRKRWESDLFQEQTSFSLRFCNFSIVIFSAPQVSVCGENIKKQEFLQLYSLINSLTKSTREYSLKLCLLCVWITTHSILFLYFVTKQFAGWNLCIKFVDRWEGWLIVELWYQRFF
jgi:hypothetical protein